MSADLKTVIASNIAELRVAKGWTQIDLAQKLNYSDKAVSKWERGESVPDITVLKQIADLFSVSVDYLLESEHPVSLPEREYEGIRKNNHPFIMGISIILVWLVATLLFVVLDSAVPDIRRHWFAFIYAVPATFIVWLVFNSIWFKRRLNFFIVSLLMWSVLGSLYLGLLPLSNIWLLFVLGIPGQIIIILWSRLKYK